MSRRRLSVDDHVRGVLDGDRAILGRTITLVESRARRHHDKAQAVLQALLPHTGRSHRIGVSGTPGVGKSTFLEALGTRLLADDHRIAVLAVDPTSERSGGSILGDKTRMARLSADPRAFIRPSPTQGELGGVHRATRETILVCEAAGFDVVFVETVGVGQSEVAVSGMVDTFLLLLLHGAGDELQGIKKGILEVADVLCVNKADGDRAVAAARARQAYASALSLLHPPHPAWKPPVLTASGLTGEGLDGVWEALVEHRRVMTAEGAFEARRQRQKLQWMWAMVEHELLARLHAHEGVASAVPSLEAQVTAGSLTPTQAAGEVLAAFSEGGAAGAPGAGDPG